MDDIYSLLDIKNIITVFIFTALFFYLLPVCIISLAGKMTKSKSVFLKTSSITIKFVYLALLLIFLVYNFPLLDWFLNSEKMWYGEYELNPDTSFLWNIYDKLGILDETVGFICSMTYGSNWMHGCYHLYNVKSCFDGHYLYALSVFFVAIMLLLTRADIKIQEKEVKRSLKRFYEISLSILLIVCLYGFCIYAPQYYSCIDDIISCI